ERERIAREQEQLLHEHERLQQERARDQARERERQQREQQRERERAERERAQAQERLAHERERTANEQAAKAARVAAIAAQLETIRAQRDAAQLQVAEMRAALQTLNAIAFPDEAALSESEHLQNELEEREAELRSNLTVAEELYNRTVLEAERRRAEIARLEQEIEDDLGPVELDSAMPRQLRLRLVIRNRTTPAASSEDNPNGDEIRRDAFRRNESVADE